jgi:succinyl-CoA synthetase beta subunit
MKDEINFAIRSPHTIEPEGNIAVLCNGMGLAMATLDLVYQSGGKPASFINLGEETTTICDRLESGLKLLTQNSRIKVILVNILAGAIQSDRLAAILGQYLPQSAGEVPMLNASNGRSHNAYNHGAIATQYAVATEVRSPVQISHHTRFVLRLAGSVAATEEHLTNLGLSVVERLDEAVSQAVSLAKQSGKK